MSAERPQPPVRSDGPGPRTGTIFAMLDASISMERLVTLSAVSDSAAQHQRLIDETWAHLAKVQVRRRHTLTTLGVIVVLGRCGCMLYLGGRKGGELMIDGPYSISRNPLYLFSIFAVLGIGLQTGSIVVGLVLSLAVFSVFRWVIGEEEQLLRVVFGEHFEAYCSRVPRFGPRPSLWISEKTVQVDVGGVWNTLRDALPYFLAIPVFELIEYAQHADWVPVWILLP